MIDRAVALDPRRVLHVQHLVIEHVFEDETRYARAVERTAYYNRGVYMIVMAQDAPRSPLAPR